MTTLTARTPADLLAAVPYMFGFHPSDSVVLVAFRGKRVIFQGRVDIPDPEHVDEVMPHLAEVAARQNPTGVTLIGYGSEERVWSVLDAFGAAVTAAGLPVLDVLRVHEGRYWSMLCDDPACCEPDGVPFDVGTSALAAAATFEGLVALPDRAALVASLAPLPGPGLDTELAAARERLAGLLGDGGRRRRAEAKAAVRAALQCHVAGGRLSDEEAAWLAVVVGNRFARDDAWQLMLGMPPADEHEALWRDMVRRVPQRYVPAPATLLSLAAWRVGNGALADVAAQRALDADPSYELAALVLQALQAGIPPSAIEPMGEPGRRRRRRTARVNPAA
jgi:hypothetical protein